MKNVKDILQKSIEERKSYKEKSILEQILKMGIEAIIKAERDEFLSCEKKKNKGNGYYQRKSRGIEREMEIDIARDRLSEFKPVFLEAVKHYDGQLETLAMKLYTKGLSTREINATLLEVFGKKISATSVSNITDRFESDRKQWQNRPLKSEYYVIYIDAIFIPVRRDTVEREAFYIVMGLRDDLRREVLGVYNNPTESAEFWREVLLDMKKEIFLQE